MIKKLAVLVVEKAGSVETLAGEKGEIYAAAREMIREINDAGNPDGVLTVTALGSTGTLKRYRWKEAIHATESAAPSIVAPASEEEEGDDEDEAKELRAKLRGAKISYSPRSGLDLLRKLVADAGL